MKAITIALLAPALFAVFTCSAVAQEQNPAYNLHLQLNRSGGAIVAEAANPEDPATTDFARGELARLAMTGVPELKPLGATVKYSFEATWDGAQILIRTEDPVALDAIHDFLRLKIRELKTGDSEQVNGTR